MEYALGVIGFLVAIGAYLNGERLRGRLNNLEDILKEKKVISQMDIVNKVIKK